MATGNIGAGLAIAFFALTTTASRGYALAICVDSKEVVVSQNECVGRGAGVMSKYFQQSQQDAGAVFGFQGKDNAAAILCDRAAKGVVFFAVSSTDEAFCRVNIQRLMKEF